jgi:hypothetical protein
LSNLLNCLADFIGSQRATISAHIERSDQPRACLLCPRGSPSFILPLPLQFVRANSADVAKTSHFAIRSRRRDLCG